MAKVPDLFEDLKNCYSENEEYSSDIDHLSLNQKSFYDASYEPLPGDGMDKFMPLSTSKTSKTSRLNFKESVVMAAANGKILKKRRLSLNQFITDDDLEAIANDTEEEIIKPRSATYSFQSNMKYNFMRVINHQCILNDARNQSIIRDPSGQYLMAAVLNNLDELQHMEVPSLGVELELQLPTCTTATTRSDPRCICDLHHSSRQHRITDLLSEDKDQTRIIMDTMKFDMAAYTSNDDSQLPVTLRISETRLFVSAQNEDEPVLLKELPETPKTIKDETSLLFFWEKHGNMDYFKSAAHPKLFIATRQEKLVHMAPGLPSVTDFQILENQS